MQTDARCTQLNFLPEAKQKTNPLLRDDKLHKGTLTASTAYTKELYRVDMYVPTHIDVFNDTMFPREKTEKRIRLSETTSQTKSATTQVAEDDQKASLSTQCELARFTCACC